MSINRREFLSLCVKGSVSTAALTSLQLQALTGATNAVELGDYKALVCVYLYGGNDSLNMLVPLEGEQRSLYKQSRQNLAVESPLELSIKSQFAGGVGIHPSLEPIQNVFESQNLAFIGGVGTLLAPTTLNDYKNKTIGLPKHLFSHNDQQAAWMYGREKQSLNSGWGARLLERLELQDGLTSAINNTQAMNSALESAPALITPFSDNSLSEQFAAVAKTISVQAKLSTQRQVFFVSMGGYDTHDNQLTTHPALLNTLAQGLSEFDSAMKELDMADKVTTFTMSDFGRTLTSNGDGTDHGWAGNQIVMGGAVKGGNIYGELLTQHLDGPQDTGGGRLIPSVANEQYFATLAQWFGVPSSELVDIFPNLSNFDHTTLGFFV